MNPLDVLSALGALAVIVGVLLLTHFGSRWYARRLSASTGMGRHIKVHERVGIGAGASLIIVEISGKFYLLGAGEKSVELICELPDFDPGSGAGVQEKIVPFGQILSELISKAKTKKRDDGGEE